MNALDPRLLRHARSTRGYLVAVVAIGTVTAGLVVLQAWLLADCVNGAFVRGSDLEQLEAPMLALLSVILARALVAWSGELASNRASAQAKSELRRSLLRRASTVGAEAPPGGTAGVAVLATRGMDSLDGYYARYLPQVFLAVIVPIVVIAAVVVRDWISAVIIAITLPLIPLLMALVGATTWERTDRDLRTLQRLSARFVDVVAGLPTLKVFGRAKAQAHAVRDMTNHYRRVAMETLRVSFLSALVLEFFSTIAVALVAVAVGLRLMGGQLDFRTALFVLVLAPEAYQPIRALGANFHASAEGVAAAEQVFALVEGPESAHGTHTDVADPATVGVEVDGVTVVYPGRSAPALDEAWLTVMPGEVLAVTGPSGCGKSTLLGVLLGFVSPADGCVRIGGVDLRDLDPAAWRERIAWIPQRPHLFAGTIADNVTLGRPDASTDDVRRAVADAQLVDVVAGLPSGLDTVLGDRGAGLSVGERQRVALARMFLRDAPLMLLDEPTAHLDGVTEAAVLDAVRRCARSGRCVILVAHRPALVALADRVVHIDPLRVTP